LIRFDRILFAAETDTAGLVDASNPLGVGSIAFSLFLAAEIAPSVSPISGVVPDSPLLPGLAVVSFSSGSMPSATMLISSPTENGWPVYWLLTIDIVAARWRVVSQ
jgi:hypothetical protein